MSKRAMVCVMITLSSFLTTGCWDRTELTQLSIVTSQGLDINDDGTFISSGEVAIPQTLLPEGGGQGSKYFVVQGTGRDIQESLQNMRAHLSRRWFAGHRQVIFISEQVAKQKGLKEIVDEYSRNPAIRLRSDMFIVQGSTALEVLESHYPFERLAGMADVQTHEELGLQADLTLRNFLIAAASKTSCPILPVIRLIAESSPEKPTPSREIGSVAVFDKDLKLVGFLTRDEGLLRRWMEGQMKEYSQTAYLPKGDGYATIDLTHLKGYIVPVKTRNHIQIRVSLRGQGVIRENTSTLDLMQQKNVTLVEQFLDMETTKEVTQMIRHVQTDFQTDIFGFDEAVLRKYPFYWKRNHLETQWVTTFATLPVVVDSQLQIKRVGLTGPSAPLQESEVQE